MLRRDPKCTRCPLHETAQYVCLLGNGPIPCDAMIVGEAPGFREDDSGKPFVGDAGKLLEKHLKKVGLKRENIFITNAVSCRPPSNRTPNKDEIEACSHWLKHQIAVVKPKFILALGNVALYATTGMTRITKLRGKPIKKDDRIILPAFHPSYILRSPQHEPTFEKDLTRFKMIVNEEQIAQATLNTKVYHNQWKELEKELRGVVSIDLETTGLYPWNGQVITVGIGTAESQWVIPFDRLNKTLLTKLVHKLKSCTTVYHNGKFDVLWLKVHTGIKWPFHFDTMLAHYLTNENSEHGLKYLAKLHLWADDWDVSLVTKQGKGDFDQLARYQSYDLYYTRKLYFPMRQALKDEPRVSAVFRHLMMPCARLFVDIEENGIFLDENGFGKAERFLKNQCNRALNRLRRWEPKGKEFNWSSTVQLRNLLFNDLGLKPVEVTAKGNASCSESALKRMDHPCIVDLLAFRAARHQLSLFIDGWRPFIHRQQDGSYIHPSFKLHGTVTGRLSCEHPNLQQVPRDSLIRSLITSPPGWELVECDLSQIELRIAAELANEQTMLCAFQNGIDIHWLTTVGEVVRGDEHKALILKTVKQHTGKSVSWDNARDVLLNMQPDQAVAIDKRWKELRKKAKSINFGFLYGMGWRKYKEYARDNYGIKVTDEEAQQSRGTFFYMYPDLLKWHQKQILSAHTDGYVETLIGRRRRLPHITFNQVDVQREAERQSVNSPVQSIASDMLLMAALELSEQYDRSVVQICGTIHDAILFRVLTCRLHDVCTFILNVMRQPRLLARLGCRLSVPIDAEISVGPWGNGRPFRT